jgi:hypothetical protein
LSSASVADKAKRLKKTSSQVFQHPLQQADESPKVHPDEAKLLRQRQSELDPVKCGYKRTADFRKNMD